MREKQLKTVKKKGAALILMVLFSLVASMVIVLGSASPVTLDLKNSQNLIGSKASYFTAETGAEDVYYRIKKGWTGTLSSPEVLPLNGGSVSTSVTTINGDEKEIVSSSNVASSYRNSKLTTITGIGADFAFVAQIGDGGLIMNNLSIVRGPNNTPGNVFSNGPISGGGTITGNAVVAMSVTPDSTALSTVCNTDENVGKASPQIDVAQSFTPSSSLPLARVSLYIKKSGAPSDISVRITEDNSGSPKTTALASGTLSAGLVGTAYAWIDVSFAAPANLIFGQKYWIVLDMPSANSSNHYIWCKDSADSYAGNAPKSKSDWSATGAWTAVAGDLAFIASLGGGSGSIKEVTVNGDAEAYDIYASATVVGTSYCQTGTGGRINCNTSKPVPSPLNMPLSEANIAQMKNDADDGTPIVGNYTVSTDQSIGPETITGDLFIANNKILTLNGVLYVMGNVSTGNGATMRCASSFGANGCILITDGYVETKNNPTFTGSGTAGSFLFVVSTKDGCNGGSQTAGCADENSAINVGNGLSGAIVYTTKSMINVGNNAQLKAIVGYKIQLGNGAEIEYDTGLANSNFTTAPGGGWNVKTWKESQ